MFIFNKSKINDIFMFTNFKKVITLIFQILIFKGLLMKNTKYIIITNYKSFLSKIRTIKLIVI